MGKRRVLGLLVAVCVCGLGGCSDSHEGSPGVTSPDSGSDQQPGQSDIDAGPDTSNGMDSRAGQQQSGESGFDAGRDAGAPQSSDAHAQDAMDAGKDSGPGNDDPTDDDDAGTSIPGVSHCKPGSSDNSVDKLDMLFVVDNSGSMREEQAALSAQFPRMIETFARGTPATTVHLGVVSTDMGLVGITGIDKCSGLGDDGILRNLPQGTSCMASYPSFLSYQAGVTQPATVASDFACIANLGTDGCGFEQQLESGLKALWPSTDNRVMFLGDVTGVGTKGHGDSENAGFLRNDLAAERSVIAVVLVSDEEDCSSLNTTHFTPNAYLDPNNPADALLLMQGLNVRCHANPQNLYPPQRYVNGLKALRWPDEDMVVFAAIVGVPPETVSQQILASTNFDDPTSRATFYTGILNHPQMQPAIDNLGTPDPQDDTITPSCESAQGKAYPPRRIVEVARGFERNGIVQSICQPDFQVSVDAIVGLIRKRVADGGCR